MTTNNKILCVSASHAAVYDALHGFNSPRLRNPADYPSAESIVNWGMFTTSNGRKATLANNYC